MIRYFFSLILTLLIITSSVVVSANAIETKFDCCCATVNDNCNVSNLNKVSDNFEIISNDYSCCLPVPNNKLPQTIIKIQNSSINTALETTSVFRLSDFVHQKVLVPFDRRCPLHLGSNELYLKKRALLI